MKKQPTRSLSDIIRYYKNCTGKSVHCDKCPYKKGAYTCDIQRLNEDVLDWLERLRKENEELKKQVLGVKAEIKQLKSETIK